MRGRGADQARRSTDYRSPPRGVGARFDPFGDAGIALRRLIDAPDGRVPRRDRVDHTIDDALLAS